MQIIPAVDVLDGKVVRLVEGDFDRVTTYSSDPAAMVGDWVDQGAELVHVVDLEGARRGQPDHDLWRSLVDADLPVQAGGGLRDTDTIRAVLEIGVQRVVVGTLAVTEPERLADLGDRVESVVAAVDVRKGRARGAGWTDQGRIIDDVLDGLAAVGVDRVLLTGIDRDGTMAGPDVKLTSRVLDDGRFRVIASGGVGSVDDLVALAALGCEAAIVGKALYESRFTLAEAQQAVS